MNHKWVHFQESEVIGLDTELVAMLDLARGKSGVPFVITSGFRTSEQNTLLPDSVSDSSHLTGHAVDLRCLDSGGRYKMIFALKEAGFNRFGVRYADGHIHVDNDTTKPQNVMW